MDTVLYSHGMRIKFLRDGDIMMSHRIYSNGVKSVRVVIEVQTNTFKFVDPATGVCLFKGPEGLTNLEVLQRHVKKCLRSYLGIHFEKEVRQKRQS